MILNSPARGRVDRVAWVAGVAGVLRVVLAAALVGSAITAEAVEPLVQHDVVLLQAGSIIEQRVEGGANAMADYVRRLGDAATEAVRANPQQIPSAGFIVVAARPGGKAHAWFDFKPPLASKTAEALTHVVETVPPAPVKTGDVVFALRVSVWGAKAPAAYAPSPQEWRDAAKQAGHKLEIEALVDQLWPR